MDKVGGKRVDDPEPPGKVQRPSFHNLVHRLQPATLIDNRIGLPGDWDTPKEFIPSFITQTTPRMGGNRFDGHH